MLRMAKMKQIKKNYLKELENILLTYNPGDEYHAKLSGLRSKMEHAYSALNGSFCQIAELSRDVVIPYSYLISCVVYDKNCLGTLDTLDLIKSESVIRAMELKFKFDPNHPEMIGQCDSTQICTYGHLLLLLTNYYYDNNLLPVRDCIFKIKYIIDLFRHHYPDIDQCSSEQIMEYLDYDDMRLYILAKLSFADMLLNANRAFRDELGEWANCREIKKVYLDHILLRLQDTPHLLPQQVTGIRAALEEVDEKILSESKEGLPPVAFFTHNHRGQRDSGYDNLERDAAEGLLSLGTKRDRDSMMQHDTHIQASFCVPLKSFNANICVTMSVNELETDEHKKVKLSIN